MNISSMELSFILYKKYGHSIKTYNNEFMLRDRLLMSLKLIIMGS